MWGAANIKKVGEGQRTPSCAGHGKVATDRCSKPQAKEVGLMEKAVRPHVPEAKCKRRKPGYVARLSSLEAFKMTKNP